MKILIIRLSSIGDIILTQPVVAAIRKQYPEATIDYITKAAFATLVEKFGCVDNIIAWEESLVLLLKLNKQKYDLCIDLHNKLNTFLIRLFTNAKRSVIYDKKHNLRRKIVAHKTTENISSTLDLYYTVLDKLGISYSPEYPKLILDYDSTSDSKNIKIGIFPGAMHKTKQYPPAKLIELISMMPDHWQVHLFGSKSEIDLCMQVESGSAKIRKNHCGKLNLDQLCYSITDMDFIISNDSGPMHIAAALHKPQLAFFGATDPVLGFVPMNEDALVISKVLNCKPCSLHGSSKCPKGHFNCMLSIDNNRVIEMVKKKITTL